MATERLAVLVVACPCGLGIATPVAVWTGLVTAARHGVIVRSAPILERTADVDRVLFDKTGTLTARTPQLIATEIAGGIAFAPDELLARAAALEAGLNHPLAAAIVKLWQHECDALEQTRGQGRPRHQATGGTLRTPVARASVPASLSRY